MYSKWAILLIKSDSVPLIVVIMDNSAVSNAIVPIWILGIAISIAASFGPVNFCVLCVPMSVYSFHNVCEYKIQLLRG